MGAARESANIWHNLIGRDYANRWRFIAFFQDGRYKNGYFWQDSFSTYFNRFIGCKIFGHRNVKDVSDYRDKTEHHCFSCYRFVDGWLNYNCKHCKLRSCWPVDKVGQHVACPECGIKQILTSQN